MSEQLNECLKRPTLVSDSREGGVGAGFVALGSFPGTKFHVSPVLLRYRFYGDRRFRAKHRAKRRTTACLINFEREGRRRRAREGATVSGSDASGV